MEINNDTSSSLEQWIALSRDGDENALNRLAEYLLPKAFEYANHKMMNLSPVDDFEDIAISAVKSVCIRFRKGQTEFLGEEELGSLLKRFIVGKIRTRRKYHFADKRNVNLDVSHADSADAPVDSPLRNLDRAVEDDKSIWLDEHCIQLPVSEQAYLEDMLNGLGGEVQGLFSELVKRLDANPRRVLMLITTTSMSNKQMAESMDCAPVSIERYRLAIRRKLEEIVNE